MATAKPTLSHFWTIVVRLLLVVVGALLAADAIAIFLLRADQPTRCTVSGARQTVCRIDEPIVTKALTDDPQMIFHPGDRITVSAGGCVQTGGSGATWKRYLNPSGPNSNRLYWGTISIPAATQGVVRISDVIGRPLTVATGIPDPLFLRATEITATIRTTTELKINARTSRMHS